MARIFMDGFETAAINIQEAYATITGDYGLWDVAEVNGEFYDAALIPSTNTPNNSAYSLDVSFPYGNRPFKVFLSKDLSTSYSKIFFKANVNIIDCLALLSMFRFYDSGLVERARISIGSETNPSLYLYVGGSLVATVTDAFTKSTWYRLEMMYDNDGSNIVIKLDGVTIVDYSGSLGGTVFRVTVGHLEYSGSYRYGYRFLVDDLAINDDTGSINNSWIGNSEIVMLKPNGAGNHSDFAASVGDAYACIDDQPFENTTDYIESSTPNNISTFTMEDLPAGTPSVNVAQILTYSKYSDTDVTNSKSVVRISSNDYLGAEKIEDPVVRHVHETIYDVNPHTSVQWTKSDIDAMEVGIQQIENI